jgi:hypothetical protein
MLTSGRDVTAKAAESQAQLMQTFITTNAQKKDSSTLETIKVLAPILAPMALKMMESRGPDAQSKAYEVLADSNMQQMAMMAQFIQTMAASQGDQSPWVPFLQQAAGGIMETIGAYMESKKQAQQQPPRLIHQGHAQPLPAPRPEAQQQAQQQVQGVTYSTEEAPTDTTAEATSADTKPSKPDATQVTNLIIANPAVPAAYKTNDWVAVIYAVHDLQPIKTTVGAYLAQLERVSPNFPPGLTDVAENPAGATRRLLEALPVWRYAPAYVHQFVLAVEREVMGEGDEAAVVEDDYQPQGTPTAAPAQPVAASTKLTTVPAPEQPEA